MFAVMISKVALDLLVVCHLGAETSHTVAAMSHNRRRRCSISRCHRPYVSQVSWKQKPEAQATTNRQIYTFALEQMKPLNSTWNRDSMPTIWQ